jgi:hypothetical protein
MAPVIAGPLGGPLSPLDALVAAVRAIGPGVIAANVDVTNPGRAFVHLSVARDEDVSEIAAQLRLEFPAPLTDGEMIWLRAGRRVAGLDVSVLGPGRAVQSTQASEKGRAA